MVSAYVISVQTNEEQLYSMLSLIRVLMIRTVIFQYKALICGTNKSKTRYINRNENSIRQSEANTEGSSITVRSCDTEATGDAADARRDTSI